MSGDSLFFAGTPQYLRIDSLVFRNSLDNFRVRLSDAHNIWYQVYSRLEIPTSDADSVTEFVDPLTREWRCGVPATSRMSIHVWASWRTKSREPRAHRPDKRARSRDISGRASATRSSCRSLSRPIRWPISCSSERRAIANTSLPPWR